MQMQMQMQTATNLCRASPRDARQCEVKQDQTKQSIAHRSQNEVFKHEKARDFHDRNGETDPTITRTNTEMVQPKGGQKLEHTSREHGNSGAMIWDF
jgi:hypothetical protein